MVSELPALTAGTALMREPNNLRESDSCRTQPDRLPPTRQQKGQSSQIGLFACKSTTCRNSMWSGRWESKTSISA